MGQPEAGVVEKIKRYIGITGRILVSMTLMLAGEAHAADVPSAGSQIQQVRPAPEPVREAPSIRVERQVAPAAPANETKILVNALRITNAKRFSEQELLAATSFRPGEAVTLSGLREIAEQVSEHYRSHGYFLAQVTVPPQDVKDGIVTLAVMEGTYGNIQVRNQSRLSEGVANGLIDGLRGGETIEMASLESSLLLLSDLPGVEVRSTLTPGSSVGAADLVIDVQTGDTITGSVEADNFGGRYTGEYRIGGSGNWNNPLGRGDVASIRILSSLDGFSYGRAAFQLQIDRASIGLAYTALEYELGEEFESLLAHGTAKIGGLYARYPILRRRHANVSVVGNLEAKQFRDELAVTSPVTMTKKRSKVASLSLLGDRNERHSQGGRNGRGNFSITWTTGQLEYRDSQALNTGAVTSLNDGHYDKVGLSASYLKQVTTSLSLFASARGQWTPDDLDVSEKLSLGGASSVRAYPEGEAYVEDGVVVTTEARTPLRVTALHLPGRWEAVGFADIGTGRSNADSNRTLSGAGIGLNWTHNEFHLQANFAHTIGAQPATSVPDSNTRFWINLVKFF